MWLVVVVASAAARAITSTRTGSILSVSLGLGGGDWEETGGGQPEGDHQDGEEEHGEEVGLVVGLLLLAGRVPPLHSTVSGGRLNTLLTHSKTRSWKVKSVRGRCSVDRITSLFLTKQF